MRGRRHSPALMYTCLFHTGRNGGPQIAALPSQTPPPSNCRGELRSGLSACTPTLYSSRIGVLNDRSRNLSAAA
jgi:hypothetical protein